jgi:hypothetical protein
VNQRVAAGHRRVVEADVGGEAPADPRPPLLERDDAYAVVLCVRDIVPLRDECVARTRKPVRGLHFVRSNGFDLAVIAKDRGSPEAPAMTMRTGRYLVAFV